MECYVLQPFVISCGHHIRVPAKKFDMEAKFFVKKAKIFCTNSLRVGLTGF